MQQTAGVKSWCQRGASLLFLVLVIREERNAEAEAAATFFKYLIGPGTWQRACMFTSYPRAWDCILN